MAAPLVFVKEVYGESSLTTGTSVVRTLSPTTPTDPGNFLALFVGWASGTITLNSVSDSQSNTWNIITTITSGAARGALAVCYNPKRLNVNDTLTFVFSAGSVGFAYHIGEFIGVKATGTPTDGSSTNTGTGASPSYTSNNATTAVADDLLLGIYFQGTTVSLTITPGNSFTAVGARRQFVNGAVQGQYRIVSATGNYANSGTANTGATSVNWGAGVWAFKISDTNAPQVSAEGAEVAVSFVSARVSAEGAEIALVGPTRAVSVVGIEVAGVFHHGAVSSAGAEVAFTPVPSTARRNPQIVG